MIKYILTGLLIVAFMAQTHGATNKSSKKPNIVFILADDLGWKDLSCYGSDFFETPNIDKLAQTGMSFTNAYAASPLCSPTRASILTGQDPGRLWFTTPAGHLEKVVLDPKETNSGPSHFKAAAPQTRTRLPNDYLTFAEVLKDNGYSTAFMGKWHLGRAPYIPENQGFDVVVGGREHPGPPGPGRYFAPWNCETLPVGPEGTHISDVLTDSAISYMTRNKEKPFLLCLWYYDVHGPFQAKEKLKKKYEKKLNAEHIQRSPTMGAMIETLDVSVGRILKSIQELNLEDETIVIFTSDNGGNMYSGPECMIPTNNYPLRGGKGINYEGGVRVPMIVRVPGVTKAGDKSEVITSSVDHYKSLLELVDIPFPENLVSDGVSYVKALKGKEYEREPIYSTFCHNIVATGNRANISMRQGPWRLYKFYFDGDNQEHRYELYNLDKDISEKNNLADKMPGKVTAMTRLLDDYTKEAGVLLPQKNIAYAGNVADAWKGSENTELSVADKVLRIKSTGANPTIETAFVPNISECSYYLKFEMISNSKGEGNISWKEGSDKIYSTEKASTFKSLHDGEWHQYSVEISLKGVLRALKIQPSTSDGLIEVKNIQLVTADNYYIRDWPLF